KKIRANNQHYNAWLHWDVTKRCNLDCEYCFGKITDPSVKVNSIDIERLMVTLDKTGKTFRISFTGGEPTMIPNFIEAVKAITKKHFVSFNTNLITKNLMKIIDEVDPQRILHIHASLHYDELVKKNLLERFIKNFRSFRENGFNIYAEAVAYPPLKEKLNELKSTMQKEEIEYSFAPFYGKLGKKIYPESYTESELKLFGLTNDDISCFSQKGKLCNAGYNTAVVFSNGNIYPCHQIKEKIGNIYKGINFNAGLVKCPSRRCGCPLNKYDEYLFNKV
ncbi:MAG: radical SAM protein, partial [Chlorobi bacterium]|nr:radical SAM protein [Chlorobiota bacterium]